MAGLALTLAPIKTFGLLFDASSLPRYWIQTGGVLFTLIGLQYLLTGLHNPPTAEATTHSSAAHPPTTPPSPPSSPTSPSSPTAPSSPNAQRLNAIPLGKSVAGAPVVSYGAILALPDGNEGFYRATVWSRLYLALWFAILVAFNNAPPGLLVLAALNLLGAWSMNRALRQKRKE